MPLSHSHILFSKNLLAFFLFFYCGVKTFCLIPLLITHFEVSALFVSHFSIPVSCVELQMELVAAFFQIFKAEVSKGLVSGMVLWMPTRHCAQCVCGHIAKHI
jgi:hypothetical protein